MSSKLNIDKSQCVILVLICNASWSAHWPRQIAAAMQGFIFAVAHQHKYISKKVPAQMFVPTTRCEGRIRHCFHIPAASHMVVWYVPIAIYGQ